MKERKKSTAGKGRRSAKPACKKGDGSEGEEEKPRRRGKVKCKAGVQKGGAVVKEREKSTAGERKPGVQNIKASTATWEDKQSHKYVLP